MYTIEELRELSVRWTGSTPSHWVDGLEVCLSQTVTAEVCVENGRLSFARAWDEQECGVRAVRERTVGFSYTTGLSPDYIRSTVSRAAEIAALSRCGRHHGFPDPAEPPVTLPESPAPTSLEELVAAAHAALRTVKLAGASVQLEFLKLSATREQVAVANSRGLTTCESMTTFVADGLCVAQREGEVSTLHVVYDGGTRLEDVRLEEALTRSAQRAAASLGARPSPNLSAVPVLLGPLAVQQLLVDTVTQSVDGYRVLSGQSRWASRIGEMVASEAVSLVDDNTLAGFVGTRRYDREGQPMEPLPLIEQGRLVNLLLDCTAARELGRPCTRRAGGGAESTAMVGVTNLVMAPGEASLEDLMEQMELGVMVERLAINKHSPDGRFFGAVKGGYLIKDGRCAYPLAATVISGNSFDLLRGVRGISREQRRLGNSLLPYVLTGLVEAAPG